MARTRMTWDAGRLASAPPAIPGYNSEDQDHPAHQADPAYEKYKKGDPDAWAETPKKPPYPQGNPPSIPGYDTEDQDHPAHKEMPRVPKEARSLRAAVERKAQKCCRIARVMLGKKASSDMVEEQALDMMDWSDSRINATLERMGGGFLADFDEGFDDDFGGPVDDFGGPEDDFGGPADDFDLMDDEDGLDMMLAEEAPMGKSSEIDGVMAEIEKLTQRVNAMKSAAKQADQNDPTGPTLSPKAKSEEAARKEARRFFASMDADRDGFVMKADWKGPKALFAALDTDGDGILAVGEVVAALAPKGTKLATINAMAVAYLKAAKKAEDDEDEDEPVASKKKAKKADDDEDDEDEPVASKKKAKKADDEEEEDDDDEPVASKKKAKKADDDEDEGDDEEDDTASKKACGDDAGMFGMTGDPMGLADGSEDVLGEDDALLAEIFGGKSAKKKAKKAEDDADDDEDEDEPVASKKKAKKAEDEEDDEEDEDEPVASKKKAKKADEDEGEEEDDEPAASKKAKKADDDEDEGDDEEEEDEEETTAAKKKAMRLASKTRTASQRPQPRKASTGIRTVGGMQRSASTGGEVDELSKLWESSPDISKNFG